MLIRLPLPVTFDPNWTDVAMVAIALISFLVATTIAIISFLATTTVAIVAVHSANEAKRISQKAVELESARDDRNDRSEFVSEMEYRFRMRRPDIKSGISDGMPEYDTTLRGRANRIHNGDGIELLDWMRAAIQYIAEKHRHEVDKEAMLQHLEHEFSRRSSVWIRSGEFESEPFDFPLLGEK